MATQYKDIIRNRYTKHYHIIGCQVFWREFSYFASKSPNMYSYSFLKQCLHNSPDILRDSVQKKIDEISADVDDEGKHRYDIIILGYGLCSKSIENIVALDIPVIIPRAHDCITLFLGSKERYREYFDKNPGTYWYTPGWIDATLMPGEKRDEELRKYYIDEYGQENADYLMEIEQGWMDNYNNLTYVEIENICDNKKYKEITKESSKYLNWNMDELKGDPSLIIKLLNGPWDEKEFLILEKGETLIATDEESTIISKK